MASIDIRRVGRNNLSRRPHVAVAEIGRDELQQLQDAAGGTISAGDRINLWRFERPVIITGPLGVISHTGGGTTDYSLIGTDAGSGTATPIVSSVPVNTTPPANIQGLFPDNVLSWVVGDVYLEVVTPPPALDERFTLIMPYYDYDRAEDHYVGTQPNPTV